MRLCAEDERLPEPSAFAREDVEAVLAEAAFLIAYLSPTMTPLWSGRMSRSSAAFCAQLKPGESPRTDPAPPCALAVPVAPDASTARVLGLVVRRNRAAGLDSPDKLSVGPPVSGSFAYTAARRNAQNRKRSHFSKRNVSPQKWFLERQTIAFCCRTSLEF